MLLRIAPARHLPANEDILGKDRLKIRPILPAEVLTGEEHDLGQNELDRWIVAYDADMGKEAAEGGTVRQLLR